MTEKVALEARILYSTPQDPIKRLKHYTYRGAFGSVLYFLIFGSGLSLITGTPLFEWKTGVVSVLISLAFLFSASLWIPRIYNASTFYLIGGLLRFPTFILLLSFGLSVITLLLPPISMMWILVGLLLGCAIIPIATISRVKWINQSMTTGHLRKSYDKGRGIWNASFDLDHILKDPETIRPGLLWRIVFWIGPAIGMSLADIYGKLNALLIVGLGMALIGYYLLVSIFTDAISRLLVLRSMERGLGKKIRLVLTE